MPDPAAALLASAAIILLGVPHGALDGEIARPHLRTRFGRAWFFVFAMPYLALAGPVLLAWAIAPMLALALFLAGSAWHFGTEDTPPGAGVEAFVRGGLPIAAPVLLRPAATAKLLGTFACVPLAQPPGWLLAASCSWLAVIILWAGTRLWQRRARALLEPAILIALFALLPPLSAFAVYFVALHAPRHVAALIADPVRAPRVWNERTAVWHAIGVTALTLLIGAALWPLYAGTPSERLVALTFQGLAALTVPHVLLDALARHLERQVGIELRSPTGGRVGFVSSEQRVSTRNA